MSIFSTAGLARISAQRPWRVVGLWLVILVLAIVSTASSLNDVLTTESDFLNKPESVRGFDLLEKRLNFDNPLTETVIVTSTNATVDDAAFQQVVEVHVPELVNLVPAMPRRDECQLHDKHLGLEHRGAGVEPAG